METCILSVNILYQPTRDCKENVVFIDGEYNFENQVKCMKQIMIEIRNLVKYHPHFNKVISSYVEKDKKSKFFSGVILRLHFIFDTECTIILKDYVISLLKQILYNRPCWIILPIIYESIDDLDKIINSKYDHSNREIINLVD